MATSENGITERLKRSSEELKADKPFLRKVARFYLIAAILLAPITILIIRDERADQAAIDAKQAAQAESVKREAAAQAESDRVLAEAAKAKEDSDREKQQFENEEAAKQAQADADASTAALGNDGSVDYEQAPHTKQINPSGCNSPEIAAEADKVIDPGLAKDKEAWVHGYAKILDGGHCVMIAAYAGLHVKCFTKFDSAYGTQNVALGKFLYQGNVYYAWMMANDIVKVKQGSPTPPMCPSDIMGQPLNYVPQGGLPR